MMQQLQELLCHESQVFMSSCIFPCFHAYKKYVRLSQTRTISNGVSMTNKFRINYNNYNNIYIVYITTINYNNIDSAQKFSMNSYDDCNEKKRRNKVNVLFI